MCPNEDSKFFVEKEYNFKSGTFTPKRRIAPSLIPMTPLMPWNLHSISSQQSVVFVLGSMSSGNRDGFCIHCKNAVPFPMIATPARASGSNLEIIADKGSEEDLISNSDLEVRFKGRAKKIPSNAVS